MQVCLTGAANSKTGSKSVSLMCPASAVPAVHVRFSPAPPTIKSALARDSVLEWSSSAVSLVARLTPICRCTRPPSHHCVPPRRDPRARWASSCLGVRRPILPGPILRGHALHRAEVPRPPIAVVAHVRWPVQQARNASPPPRSSGTLPPKSRRTHRHHQARVDRRPRRRMHYPAPASGPIGLGR